MFRTTLVALGLLAVLAAPPWAPLASASYPQQIPTTYLEYNETAMQWSAGGERIEGQDLYMDEFCIHRRNACVGPYYVPAGRDIQNPAYVRVWSLSYFNATYNGSWQSYHGPYEVEMPVGDDLNVCHFRCFQATPGRVVFNETLTVEAGFGGFRLVNQTQRVSVNSTELLQPQFTPYNF